MAAIRDIGIEVRAPKREPAPGDRLNPFNGSLPVRGSVIIGTVVSAKMQGSAVVEKQHQRMVQKFERIEKRTRRYPVHVPSNIDVAVGDEVTIAECRPISKTVNFVVVENRGNPALQRREEGTPSPAGKTPPSRAAGEGAKKAAPKKAAASKKTAPKAPKDSGTAPASKASKGADQ